MNGNAGIPVTCPGCGKALRVKAELAGRRVRCPDRACGSPIDVPLPGARRPPPARKPGRARWPWVVAAAVIALGAGLAGGFLIGTQQPSAAEDRVAEVTRLTSANKDLQAQQQALQQELGKLKGDLARRAAEPESPKAGGLALRNQALEREVGKLKEELAKKTPDALKAGELAAENQGLKQQIAKLKEELARRPAEADSPKLKELAQKSQALEQLVGKLKEELAKARAGSPGKAQAPPGADKELYRRLLPSCVWVVMRKPSKPGTLVLQQGSGWVVDHERRLIVTNYHVVGDYKEVQALFPMYAKGELVTERRPYFPLIANRKAIQGKVLALDVKRDLALIQLDSLPKDAAAIPFAPKGVSVGDRVYTLGNPGGNNPLWKFDVGPVLGVKRYNVPSKREGLVFTLDTRAIQAGLKTRTGQSGSPLVNGAGEIVGVMQGSPDDKPDTSLFIERDEVLAFLAAHGVPIQPAPNAPPKASSLPAPARGAGHFGAAAFGRPPSPGPGQSNQRCSSTMSLSCRTWSRLTVWPS